MLKANKQKSFTVLIFLFVSLTLCGMDDMHGMISGRVVGNGGQVIDYATVQLKGTSYGCVTDDKGLYRINAPAGKYIVTVSAMGYNKSEKEVTIKAGNPLKLDISMTMLAVELDGVSIVSAGVSRLKKSAYNAVSIDTRDMLNTTKTLSEAMAKAPGLKLRETGGVGSDMAMMVDGFSGRHVKVFIDGVP